MISDYKDLTPVQMRHLIREGRTLSFSARSTLTISCCSPSAIRKPALCWRFSIREAASPNLWQKIAT